MLGPTVRVFFDARCSVRVAMSPRMSRFAPEEMGTMSEAGSFKGFTAGTC